MKIYYVEDFVNARYRVDLNFEALITHEYSNESTSNLSRIVVSIVAIIGLFFCLIKLWWFAVILYALLLAFALLTNWIQSKMKVVFSKKFILLTMLVLFVMSVVSMGICMKIDSVKQAEVAELAKQQHQKEVAERLEQERLAKEQERLRQDSLSFHIAAAERLVKGKKQREAIEEYKKAAEFADVAIAASLFYKIANMHFANKQYEEALSYYQKSMAGRNSLLKDSLDYNLAVCYANTGNVAAAVNALKYTTRTSRVETLFNKLNPVKIRYSYVEKPVEKKKVAYRTILCRDGSTSHSSSRRGTCSRHGGVSDWEHPVYETYTENQRQKVAEKYREYGEW